MIDMNPKTGDMDMILEDFFYQDDLNKLTEDVGKILHCPILVLDLTFRIVALYITHGFSDVIFDDAVKQGKITYESSAVIHRKDAEHSGKSDYIKLEGSDFRRRFAPLKSAGVKLGYMICVDVDGHLPNIDEKIWNTVEMVLSKQLFIETSRHDKPFETAEDILMHLLDGGFSSETYFRLQAANTYLSDFDPLSFALVDLTTYHSGIGGCGRHLKEDLNMRLPGSHSLLYRGNVFLFIEKKRDIDVLKELAEEYRLKIIISDINKGLFKLHESYGTALEALRMIVESDFSESCIYSVDQLRMPLMLKSICTHDDLVAQELRNLADHDIKKDTQYCETLYYYLICSRSLKKTCDMLYAHRNTVLYRVRKMQEDFGIPLDEPGKHTTLLLSTAVLLFERNGLGFFLGSAFQNGAE